MRTPTLLLVLLALATPHAMAANVERTYRIHYGAEFRPNAGVAAVTIRVEQPRSELRRITLTAPRDRYRDFEGKGVRVSGDEVVWEVPARGGELRFLHVVDHRRSADGYDARLTANWAILKADRLFPRMRARTVKGARALASLSFTGPEGWLYQTRYGRVREALAFDDSTRDFDRPTGWMVVGRIAARREDIAGRYVLVASPAGESYRHNDVLAFLSWNLPVIVDLLPGFPQRLLIVGASGEMWRGGLSGAASLYLHGDRPFVSQNGTSPMLHELMHVGSRLAGDEDGDWIVEGLAEYYSMETLRRSGTISQVRYDRAFAHLETWADRDRGCLARTQSSGPDTARAVLVLRDLDRELRTRTGEKATLDLVLRRLVAGGPKVSESRLRRIVEEFLGGSSRVLGRLPRCD
jgi:hypothetical protein